MASSAFRVQGRPEDRVAAGGTASVVGGGGGSDLTYRGETDFLDVAVDPVAGTVTTSLSPGFVNRVVALEEMRSLIQIKDSLASGGPSNYMDFPVGANYIDTPSNAAFNVAGDCGFAIRVQLPASTPANDWCVFSRRSTTAATTQVSGFIQADGQMHGTVSVNGTSISAGTSIAATPLAFDGRWLWLRMTRQASTGQWDFYTATDTGSNNILPASWTTFSLNRGSAVGTMWNPGAVPFEINGHSAGATNTLAGKVGRVIMYDNETMTGTPILDCNASDYTSGTSWTGPQGNVWTLHGTASVVLVGGAISNTTAEFSLGETDPFATIPLEVHDTLLWSTEATIVNTSGSNVNFTPKLMIAGVNLFTFDPIVIPSSASKVYPVSCAVKVSINAEDGTTQIAGAQLIVGNAVTGTDAGSSIMPTPLATVGPGVRSGAIATITTVPQMQLRMTMGTASPSASARPIRTELFISKA